MQENQYYQMKLEVLFKFLQNIIFAPCTLKTLEETVQELGHKPAFAKILFPSELADLFRFFSEEIDKKQALQLENQEFYALKVREKIFVAVKTRLELYSEYKEAVRVITHYYFRPSQWSDSFRGLWHDVDGFWRLAGDQSTDFNHYSKRLILASVYSATLLYWLEDDSSDHQQSWEFLQRRIDNVMKMNKMKLFGQNLASKMNEIPFLRLITRKVF